MLDMKHCSIGGGPCNLLTFIKVSSEDARHDEYIPDVSYLISQTGKEVIQVFEFIYYIAHPWFQKHEVSIGTQLTS
uniref:Uncharacterized protein n=1 Tax=Arundo donax TaxID=35708 RepID=A0A0A9H7U8_ARUDO